MQIGGKLEVQFEDIHTVVVAMVAKDFSYLFQKGSELNNCLLE